MIGLEQQPYLDPNVNVNNLWYNVFQSMQESLAESEGATAISGSRMSDVDVMTSLGTIPNIAELSREQLTEVYDNYNFNHHPQNQLPITAHKQRVS